MVITSGNISGWCYDPCIRWIRVCAVCYTYRLRTKLSAHPSQMEQPAEDKVIKCTRYNEDGTKCNATFTFTVDEQQAYQARNHSDPRSCAKHRKSAGYNANGGPCRKFMAGVCENGDQCPYSHAKMSDSREIVSVPASG